MASRRTRGGRSPAIRRIIAQADRRESREAARRSFRRMLATARRVPVPVESAVRRALRPRGPGGQVIPGGYVMETDDEVKARVAVFDEEVKEFTAAAREEARRIESLPSTRHLPMIATPRRLRRGRGGAFRVRAISAGGGEGLSAYARSIADRLVADRRRRWARGMRLHASEDTVVMAKILVEIAPDERVYRTIKIGTDVDHLRPAELRRRIQRGLIDSVSSFRAGSALPDSFSIVGSSLELVEIDWAAACGSRAANRLQLTCGTKLQSAKSKPGECGLTIVARFLKKNKIMSTEGSGLSVSGVKRIRMAAATIETMMCLATGTASRNLNSRPKTQGWTPEELYLVLKECRIGLTVHILEHDDHGVHLSAEPVRTLRGVSDRATLRLCWLPAGSPFSGVNGDERHFMQIMGDENRCPQCGVSTAFNGKKHYCKWTCEKCSHVFNCSRDDHDCIREAEQRKQLIAQQIKPLQSKADKERRVFANMICSGEVDDTERVAAFGDHVRKGYNVALLGLAGTGKTYAIIELVKQLIAERRFEKSEIAVVAGIGRVCTEFRELSALGFRVSTIHSYLGYRPDQPLRMVIDSIKASKGSDERRLRLTGTKLLIIDEAPSTSLQLFTAMNQVLQAVRESTQVMGGIQSIMVGDFCQAIPNGESADSNSDFVRPLFEAELWMSMKFKRVLLLQQHRMGDTEEDRDFNIARVNMALGTTQLRDFNVLNRNCLGGAGERPVDNMDISDDDTVWDDPDVVHAVHTNLAVYEIGQAQHKRFFTEAETTTFLPIVDGGGVIAFTSAEYRVCDPELTVAVGSPVMATDNQHLKKFSVGNGSIGKVAAIEDDLIHVQFETHDEPIAFKRTSFVTAKKVKFKHFPLRKAYALTVQKSQGATLAKVCYHPPATYLISNNKSMAGLAYVALSRVRESKNFSMARQLMPAHVVNCAIRTAYMFRCGSDLSDRNLLIHCLKVGGESGSCFSAASYGYTSYLMRKKKKQEPADYAFTRSKKDQSEFYELRRKVKELKKKDAASLTDAEQALIRKFKAENAAPFLTRVQVAQRRRDGTIPSKFCQHGANNIFIDFETYEKQYTSELGVEVTKNEVYAVYAEHEFDFVVKDTFLDGVSKSPNPDGSGYFNPGALHRSVGWIMSIVDKLLCGWMESGRKHRGFPPIVMSAYNGARFDFLFIVRAIFARMGEFNEHYVFVPTAIKGGGTICAFEIRFDNGKHKRLLLKFWDPCQILGSSLDKAHKDLLPVQHSRTPKGVFPHHFVNRVGASEAFSADEARCLNIEADFPYQMQEKVHDLIKDGKLLAGASPGTVMFNPLREHHEYVMTDVIVMKNVMERVQGVVWCAVPGKDILVHKSPTAASLSLDVFALTLKSEFRPKLTMEVKVEAPVRPPVESKEAVESKGTIHRTRVFRDCMAVTGIARPDMEQAEFIRGDMAGGIVGNRTTKYESPQFEQVLDAYEAIDNEDIDPEEARRQRLLMYLYIRYCLGYYDANGLYAHIARVNLFPLGAAVWINGQLEVQAFMNQYMECRAQTLEDKSKIIDFPQFWLQADFRPGKSNIEPTVPRHHDGKVYWDCTDRKNEILNSTHVGMILDQGGTIENPTRVLVYGTHNPPTHPTLPGRWRSNSHQIFQTHGDLCLKLRHLGGACKVMGKNFGNSLVGTFAIKELMDLTRIYYSKDPESADAQRYLSMIADKTLSLSEMMTNMVGDEDLIYRDPESGELVDPRPVLKICKFTKLNTVEDGGLSKRAPQITSLVLAMAHKLMSEAMDAVMGEDRYNGKPSMIYYSDTDSIFIPLDRAYRLNLHTKQLGSFSDDLDGYYDLPKKPRPTALEDISIEELMNKMQRAPADGTKFHTVIGEDGCPIMVPDDDGKMIELRLPSVVKIIKAYFPAKKVYFLIGIEPISGKLVFIEPKCKGIGKYELAVLNVAQFREARQFARKRVCALVAERHQQVLEDENLKELSLVEQRHLENTFIQTFLSELTYDQTLKMKKSGGRFSKQAFKEMVDESIIAKAGENAGLVTVSKRMQRKGLITSAADKQRGIESADIETVFFPRTLLGNSAKISDDRVMHADGFSVPLGWVDPR